MIKWQNKMTLAVSFLLAICVLLAGCGNILGNTDTTVGSTAETTESVTVEQTSSEESSADTVTAETATTETTEQSQATETVETTETTNTTLTESSETVETAETTETVESDTFTVSETTEATESNTDAIGTTETGTDETDTSDNSDGGELEIPALSLPTIDISTIPPYESEPYVEINGNIPFFTSSQKVTTTYEYYSPLDSLGRCGTAVVCAGKDLMPTEDRGNIGSVTPSGWHSVSYDIVSGGSLYNRSHLIAHQISGEDANKLNLITGTRFLNVIGMIPFENLVADHVKETGNHVMYRVTPIFVGNELVARGVLMEGWSVEDNGDGVCFNVYLYNVQPGIIIDYATGDSRIDPDYSPSTDVPMYFIINVRNGKFHYTYCSSVSLMSEANKKEVFCTRDELTEQGYTPCGSCKP